MQLDQIDIVVALKQHLEQHRQRLKALEGERMAFRVNVKQAGIDFVLMSEPHGEKDKEASGIQDANAYLIKRILIVEVQARINKYTTELEKYGVTVQQTHIKAA